MIKEKPRRPVPGDAVECTIRSVYRAAAKRRFHESVRDAAIKNFFNNTIVTLVSLLVVLGIAELILQQFSPDRFYVWPPGLQRTFRPSPGIMPGVHGESRLSINAHGLRGSEWPPTDGLRILAVGGSTTECLYLDDAETWPALLEAKLRDATGSDARVGNVGRSGHDTRHHVLQVDKMLDQYPHIDVVLLMIGINDLELRLKRDATYVRFSEESRRYRQKLYYRSFALVPPLTEELPFVQSLALWQQGRQLKHVMRSSGADDNVQDTTGDIYTHWRRIRKNAVRLRPELPDLSVALDEFAANVRRIVDIGKRHGVTVVLLTQPSMYRSDLPQDLADLLWFGSVGEPVDGQENEYYSAAAMATGLDQYNRTTLELCRELDTPCIDAAAEIPRDATMFYDDVHFNEGGARKVTEIISRQFLDRPRVFGIMAPQSNADP